MPEKTELLPGTLILLLLRVLQHQPLHGYAIAQRILLLSEKELLIEEGSLYPALQKMLLKGWVTADWGISESNRKVRVYQITKLGRKQLASELDSYERSNRAVQSVLKGAESR